MLIPNYLKKVYVFRYKDMYKIGVSNNIANRIASLRTGCPTIEIQYTSDYIKNPYQVESVLHNIFDKNKIAGEWFSEVDISLVNTVVEKVGEFVNLQEEEHKYKKSLDKFAVEIAEDIKRFYLSSLGYDEYKSENVYKRLDFEHGWKLNENDKDFLLKYFSDYADIIEKQCCGDGLEDILVIIQSLRKFGVDKTKDLIQEHAKELVDSVFGEIYNYYDGNFDKDIIFLIENSIMGI